VPIGCNLAWGLIDGIMYLMACLSEKGQNLRTLHVVRRAANPSRVSASLPGVASRGCVPPATGGLERMRPVQQGPSR
jgi:hypothetical protein